MGNVCSFDSPDLIKYAVIGTGATAVSYIPTFAIAATNAAYLSASGAFRSGDVNGFPTPQRTCSFATKTTTYSYDGTTYQPVVTTATVQPYIIGPYGVSASATSVNCAPLTPSTTNTDTSYTTYNTLSCPSVVLSALQTGTYYLGFQLQGGDYVTYNTFVIATPLPGTTTLSIQPATTVSQLLPLSTSTSTSSVGGGAPVIETSPTSTPSRTVVSTQTVTSAVYTATVVRTTTLGSRRLSIATVTSYIQTTTRTLTSTVTSTSTICNVRRKNKNKRGAATSILVTTTSSTTPQVTTTSSTTPQVTTTSSTTPQVTTTRSTTPSTTTTTTPVNTRIPGHPDITYPPIPGQVSVTPSRSGTLTQTVYFTATVQTISTQQTTFSTLSVLTTTLSSVSIVLTTTTSTVRVTVTARRCPTSTITVSPPITS